MNDLLKYRSATLRIVGIYALVGCLWIYTSDTVLDWFVRDPHIMAKIAIYKGIFYVIFTSLLLYFLINRFNSNLAVSEQALRASENKFRNIFDHSPIAIGIGDVHSGKLVEVNGAWLRLFGYERDEVINRSTEELRIYTTSVERDKLIRMVKAQGSIVNHSTKLCHKSGTNIDVLYSADLISIGSKPYLQVMLTDVSERKRSDDALRLTRFSIDCSSDGFFWMTPDARIVDVNEAACRSLGYSREELLQLTIPEIDPFYNADVWRQHFIDLRQHGSLKFETVHTSKDGKQFPVEIVANYIMFGTEECNCAIVRNITERKQAEEDKQLFEQQLQHTQKLESLGVLAGGIAHDFNNILAIIMGYCSLTKMDYETAENNVPEIEKAVERAAGLCRQMLAYAGKAQCVQAKVNFETQVTEAIELLKASLPQNVIIKYDCMPDIPFINADTSQISQVVMNLIINASEAIGKEQGEVRVSLTKVVIRTGQTEKDYLGKIIPPGSYVCLEVVDNGCGMSDETYNRIFEPFFTTKFTGRGLGMSAVLGIITAHKGSLQLSSKLGEGTTFKVFLPACKDSFGDEPQKHASTELWRGSGTILLVEDEGQVRLIAKALLNKMGFTVLEAVNGKEALELYQRNATDITLVMTDMGMPIMDGYELFYELKKLHPELPIIVSSGYGDAEVGSRLSIDDIAGLISKPYGPDQLREVLKRALEGLQ